jgi:anti-sigma regulatory factor (Ser/Thr protein kinase)
MNLNSIQIDIATEADQTRSLLAARKIASEIGFNAKDIASITTAVSELVRNILKYAGNGRVRFDPAKANHTKGLRITVRDHGPGIADVEKAMADHFSSSGTLGLGLPGVKRMMDDFEIESASGQGTRVVVTKWLSAGKYSDGRSKQQTAPRKFLQDHFQKRTDRSVVERSPEPGGDSPRSDVPNSDPGQERGKFPEWGIWGRPCGGEIVSGDTAVVVQVGNEVVCAVIDVLGHGPDAHKLAKRIEIFLEDNLRTDPVAMLHLLHSELRGTRGAVAGVAAFDPQSGKVRFAACGNITARRMGNGEVRLNSTEGTLGQSIRSPSEQTVVLQKKDVLLIHTDGVKSRFDTSDYPRIHYEHASTIAKTVVEKFGRSYDDATCLALRYAP